MCLGRQWHTENPPGTGTSARIAGTAEAPRPHLDVSLAAPSRAPSLAQREAEADLRLPATDPLFGRWPGAGGPVGLAPTRLYGLKESLFGDEHLALGTWRIKPVT